MALAPVENFLRHHKGNFTARLEIKRRKRPETIYAYKELGAAGLFYRRPKIKSRNTAGAVNKREREYKREQPV